MIANSLRFPRIAASSIFACVVPILFGAGAQCCSADEEVRDSRPNIVLIMCDDMGWSDIGCYGGEIETPNLDRLAQGGVRFRTFYNNAKCEHTRASLLTGRWWHHVGASASVHYAAPTFGERMRDAGYRTLMTGKWHAGQTPYQRGFDRHFGLTDGCCNFWNPGHARPGEPEPAKKMVRRWADDEQEYLPYTPESSEFYTTDAFTNKAVEYLHQYRDEEQPFLLYVAYTAPHYPMHASEEDVAKYRGKYGAIGWDKLREQRFARQQQLGILPDNAVLSPRDARLPAWDDIKSDDRDWWDLRMATYAAMVDRLDRNIGKLLGTIDDIGESDNTLVFFLSDNGACEDSADRSTVKGSMPWEVTSFLTQGRHWANASNTPFRKYKTTDYEGGTRTPLIAYWPGKIAAGTTTDHVGHLTDFMPTMLDLAQADITDELPGHSLVPALRGETVERPWPIYWQFGKAKAIRNETHKLVQYDKGDWELYNLVEDPCELDDLAKREPELVNQFRQQWETWWKNKPAK
ncbi:arylsulfatase [Rhodopirellula sp. MGV]|uniref:arylsulfatase n=1 Tax=Rhodopirellula sp. MGV TaxID=2023130 RepID=UPI000B979A85|nr:arylsulfatase [Rhodopirellula sp. MGV]OYP34399.1 arylsulfatase [Rhodopirellula sp. MGV]PNY37426.1 arylsulfatase [Rhodopirellula baltica]